MVAKWEKEWQEKQAKEASEVRQTHPIFATFIKEALSNQGTTVFLRHPALCLRVKARDHENRYNGPITSSHSPRSKFILPPSWALLLCCHNTALVLFFFSLAGYLTLCALLCAGSLRTGVRIFLAFLFFPFFLLVLRVLSVVLFPLAT